MTVNDFLCSSCDEPTVNRANCFLSPGIHMKTEKQLNILKQSAPVNSQSGSNGSIKRITSLQFDFLSTLKVMLFLNLKHFSLMSLLKFHDFSHFTRVTWNLKWAPPSKIIKPDFFSMKRDSHQITFHWKRTSLFYFQTNSQG